MKYFLKYDKIGLTPFSLSGSRTYLNLVQKFLKVTKINWQTTREEQNYGWLCKTFIQMVTCNASLSNHLFINLPIHLFFEILIPFTWFIVSSFNSFFAPVFFLYFYSSLLIYKFLYFSFYRFLTLSFSSLYQRLLSITNAFPLLLAFLLLPGPLNTHTHTQISRLRLIMQIFVLTRSSPL
jgi:hypothetical protein